MSNEYKLPSISMSSIDADCFKQPPQNINQGEHLQSGTQPFKQQKILPSLIEAGILRKHDQFHEHPQQYLPEQTRNVYGTYGIPYTSNSSTYGRDTFVHYTNNEGTYHGIQQYHRNTQESYISRPEPVNYVIPRSTSTTSELRNEPLTTDIQNSLHSSNESKPIQLRMRQPDRKSKYCKVEGCTKKKQTRGLCKMHGGGSRCSFVGCTKSNQGGGFCRSHGGGKKCSSEGCTKGAQRGGLCHGHGGIRYCIVEGCKRKDRGSGYCVTHEGMKICLINGCRRVDVNEHGVCNIHQETKQ